MEASRSGACVRVLFGGYSPSVLYADADFLILGAQIVLPACLRELLVRATPPACRLPISGKVTAQRAVTRSASPPPLSRFFPGVRLCIWQSGVAGRARAAFVDVAISQQLVLCTFSAGGLAQADRVCRRQILGVCRSKGHGEIDQIYWKSAALPQVCPPSFKGRA